MLMSMVMRGMVVLRFISMMLAAAVLMPTHGSRYRLVVLCAQLRQLLQERHQSPDCLIAVRCAPGGHCRQLDTVLDNPELARSRRLHVHIGVTLAMLVLRKIGRLWIQASPDFGILYTGR